MVVNVAQRVVETGARTAAHAPSTTLLTTLLPPSTDPPSHGACAELKKTEIERILKAMIGKRHLSEELEINQNYGGVTAYLGTGDAAHTLHGQGARPLCHAESAHVRSRAAPQVVTRLHMMPHPTHAIASPRRRRVLLLKSP